MATEFCPPCRTARVGALRYCRSCAFDYDTLPAPEVAPAPPVVPPAAPEVRAAPPDTIAVALPGGSSRRTWIVLGAVIFAAVVAAAAFLSVSGSGALAPRHDITGTFELSDTSTISSGILAAGSTCEGTGGYSDIGLGTNVTLKDGDGKLLATGSLGLGKGGSTRCTFTFTLSGVPETPFYTVEVGRRGALSYSLADMKSFDWTLGLTLGD